MFHIQFINKLTEVVEFELDSDTLDDVALLLSPTSQYMKVFHN